MTRSDLHVVLIVEPETAAERERDSRLIDHGGISSDRRQMLSLREIYGRRFEELQAAKGATESEASAKKAVLIDTTAMPKADVSLCVISSVVDVLRERVYTDFTFSDKWLLSTIEGYFPKVRGNRRAHRAFAKEFVVRANRLTEPKRRRLAESIDRAAAPAEFFDIGARASVGEGVSQVIKSLEDLFRRAAYS